MSIAVSIAPARRLRLPGLPSPRRLLTIVLLLLVVALVSSTVATIAYLRLPSPTGAFGVGRVETLLTDPSRTEPAERGGGRRAVGLTTWYPAERNTGRPAAYVPHLDRIAGGLKASGELPGPVVAGIRFVGTAAQSDARVAAARDRYPVVLLSPGNATNVAFYSALAEELASRGFVVVGIDHPFQGTAVDVGDRVAVYQEPRAASLQDAVAFKIDERVTDLTFVLDRLGADSAGLVAMADRIDLDHIGVVGHSNGGIAAARLCADERVDACANIDGLGAGGPFSARPEPQAPTKPFVFLTKERSIAPKLVDLFEAGGADTYRVVVPAAEHDSFSDGPRFRPRLLPTDGTSDQVLTVERQFVGAFFAHYLSGAPASAVDGLNAPTDVYIEVYPLHGRPSLPATR